MRGRMIYFDRRVYTQCVLITKVFIADHLETPVAFDKVLGKGSDYFHRDIPSHPYSLDRRAFRIKIIRHNYINYIN